MSAPVDYDLLGLFADRFRDSGLDGSVLGVLRDCDGPEPVGEEGP